MHWGIFEYIGAYLSILRRIEAYWGILGVLEHTGGILLHIEGYYGIYCVCCKGDHNGVKAKLKLIKRKQALDFTL